MYWGNSGFEGGGLILGGVVIIGGRIMYVQMYMYVDMGMDLQGSIKDPNAAEKEPQLC